MTQIGTVYGGALYQLAAEEDISAELLTQLQVLNDSLRENEEFVTLLDSPALPKAERCGILQESFGGILHPYVLNFLKILTEEGHIRHFSKCCEAYHSQYNADHNILPVTAVSAIPLNDGQLQRLTEKLQNVTGSTIQLKNLVDLECLGGIRLELDGKCLDDTVAHRLQEIRELLQKTVL
jgi:F-type H+-transporting ATPase subunit delta